MSVEEEAKAIHKKLESLAGTKLTEDVAKNVLTMLAKSGVSDSYWEKHAELKLLNPFAKKQPKKKRTVPAIRRYIERDFPGAKVPVVKHEKQMTERELMERAVMNTKQLLSKEDIDDAKKEAAAERRKLIRERKIELGDYSDLSAEEKELLDMKKAAQNAKAGETFAQAVKSQGKLGFAMADLNNPDPTKTSAKFTMYEVKRDVMKGASNPLFVKQEKHAQNILNRSIAPKNVEKPVPAPVVSRMKVQLKVLRNHAEAKMVNQAEYKGAFHPTGAMREPFAPTQADRSFKANVLTPEEIAIIRRTPAKRVVSDD